MNILHVNYVFEHVKRLRKEDKKKNAPLITQSLALF
jgi:hypothetical protein